MSDNESNDFDKIMKIIENNIKSEKSGEDATALTEEMKNISQKFIEDAQNKIITATSVSENSNADDALVIIEANLTFDVTKIILNFEDEEPSEQIKHLKNATQDLLLKMQVGMQDQFKDMMF